MVKIFIFMYPMVNDTLILGEHKRSAGLGDSEYFSKFMEVPLDLLVFSSL
jgi:hypothetical protein